MKKRDIVERVAGEADTTKHGAEAAVGAVFGSIAEALARGEARAHHVPVWTAEPRG